MGDLIPELRVRVGSSECLDVLSLFLSAAGTTSAQCFAANASTLSKVLASQHRAVMNEEDLGCYGAQVIHASVPASSRPRAQSTRQILARMCYRRSSPSHQGGETGKLSPPAGRLCARRRRDVSDDAATLWPGRLERFGTSRCSEADKGSSAVWDLAGGVAIVFIEVDAPDTPSFKMDRERVDEFVDTFARSAAR